MNARRYPRTCDEAFGPYQRSSQCEIQPMGGNPKTPVVDVVLFVVGVIGVVVALVFNNFS